MNAFEVLKSRSFVSQYTPGLPEQLASGAPVTFYLGVDPTSDSMHIGHLFPTMAAAHLQRAGHVPIALVGGGTAMVGDPTGKDESRQLITAEQIEHNKAGIRAGMELVLDLSPGRGHMVDNADWLMGLSYIPFLRDVGRHFTMNTMMGRTSVQQRMERGGFTFLEFNYQILQAYDYLELYRRYGCALQIGGDDQWGNIIGGVDLIRRMEGAEVQAFTFPLLTTSSGRKMGKTEKGSVWLSAHKTSPYDYFQYWVNVDDADVGRLLRVFTFLPIERIEELEALQGADIREAKQVLALEATAIAHGHTEAQKALAGARAAFSGGGAVAAMPQHAAALPAPLVDLLVDTGLCGSKSDARRQIKGGAVRLGRDREQAVSDIDLVIDAAALEDDGSLVLWRGKKNAVRVVVAG